MKHVAIAVLLAAACSSHGPPITNRGSGSAPVTSLPPKRLTLVEGTPQTLDDGLVLRVSKVLYAHMKGDKNLSMATIIFSRGGQSTEEVFERGDEPSPKNVDGWRITLEAADPYHQPASATFLVERVP
jgi:hypothetical protein